MLISINSTLTEISLSHSFKCPLGGGFWSVEAGANCTEDGQPYCTCYPKRARLQFEDGSGAIVVNITAEFVEKYFSEALNEKADAVRKAAEAFVAEKSL
jgi:hypothetical protein